MRILQVRFKNLNSLVGEWNIDLAHPAFTADGIFAITGPTGAGKTTILDAICLALYGRTPRLNKVTKSSNEIMSRQSGDCFAEVTFETGAGRFRCHWSQHRARKKADGDLQAPKHEIADADSDKVITAKLRDVAEQIELTTGMDFDRFTRSMLLAQGGFAAFLQAAADQRAPILEQITGTEIYSQISIRVHQLSSAEGKKLEVLRAELAGMHLLTDEEKQQLSASLNEKVDQETELNKQIEEKNKALAWLDGMARLAQELTLVEEQQCDWQIRHNAFAPEYDKLQRASKALELAGDYAGLSAIRHQQETDRHSHGECLQVLPRCQDLEKRAEEVMKQAGSQLQQRKVEQKEISIIIKQVRELDLKLGEKNAPLAKASAAITDLEQSFHALQSRQNNDVKAVNYKQELFNKLVQSLADTQVDAALVEQLTGMCSRFDTAKQLHGQHNLKLEQVKAAAKDVTTATGRWQQLNANLNTKRVSLATIQSDFDRQQLDLKTVLEGSDLINWRHNLSALKDKKAIIDNTIEAVQSVTQVKLTIDALGKRHHALTTEQSDLAKQLQFQMKEQTSLEREIALLENQLTLLKTIESLNEVRTQLKDGEDCPLCGAKEHPFAQGNISQPDETLSALARVRVDLKTVHDAGGELRIKQAEVNKDLEQIVFRCKEGNAQLMASETLIGQHCAVLKVDDAGLELGRCLQGLNTQIVDEMGQATRIVQVAEVLEREIEGLRISLDKTTASVVADERETQTAIHAKDSAQQQVERLQQETESFAVQLGNALSALQEEVAAYGFAALSVADLDQIQAALIARRDQWMMRQQQHSALDQQLIALKLQTRHQAEQIQTFATELKTQRDSLNILQREQRVLQGKRRQLFGDKNPDDEEIRLGADIDLAETGLDVSRQALHVANQELGKLNARIEELDRSLAARAIQVKEVAAQFLVRLGELGFADESHYQAACLPDAERKELAHQAEKLAKEQTELLSRERDKRAQLEIEGKKQLTEQPRNELDQALVTFIASHNELQQAIGGISQRLNENEALHQRQQTRIQAIEAQQKECSRWELLHELIGSADGKKYRNFAQGLTFELMIGHANRQLQKMSDRYLLIRDEKAPLELNVIDNYQAGEMRSTKNLSGGESFIVSLALALGLSHMASKNVRVDSLFLDEGFGTLDDEALDTALETLAGLQQEGKLIGVISHVATLKERISAQIHVSPQTGGRSVISGPGCRLIS